MGPIHELAATQLYHRTDPKQFDFGTTAALEDLVDVLGQPRAVAAMRFGIGMPRDGYNIFVAIKTSSECQTHSRFVYFIT